MNGECLLFGNHLFFAPVVESLSSSQYQVMNASMVVSSQLLDTVRVRYLIYLLLNVGISVKKKLVRKHSYTPKVLDCCFCFFSMSFPLQQIKWKNKNIFILEVG